MNDLNLARRRVLFGIFSAAGYSLARSIAFSQAPENDHDNRINPPQRVPDVPVLCDSGATVGLASLLKGRVTAIQLIFTSCSTTCPIEAAIFQQVQDRLSAQTSDGIQLLSLSVDPETDTPDALHAWLGKFHARSGWIAAAPRMNDLPLLRKFFGDDGRAVANHNTRVQIINRRGELIWRTFDFPSSDSIAGIINQMRRGRS